MSRRPPKERFGTSLRAPGLTNVADRSKRVGKFLQSLIVPSLLSVLSLAGGCVREEEPGVDLEVQSGSGGAGNSDDVKTPEIPVSNTGGEGGGGQDLQPVENSCDGVEPADFETECIESPSATRVCLSLDELDLTASGIFRKSICSTQTDALGSGMGGFGGSEMASDICPSPEALIFDHVGSGCGACYIVPACASTPKKAVVQEGDQCCYLAQRTACNAC